MAGKELHFKNLKAIQAIVDKKQKQTRLKLMVKPDSTYKEFVTSQQAASKRLMVGDPEFIDTEVVHNEH